MFSMNTLIFFVKKFLSKHLYHFLPSQFNMRNSPLQTNLLFFFFFYRIYAILHLSKFLPKLTPRILQRSLHRFPNINSSSFPNISFCVAILCTILASPLFAPSIYRINDATSLEKHIYPASKPLWVAVGESLYLLAFLSF